MFIFLTSLLSQELLGKLFRVFLAPHPNSGVILAHAWHSQSIQIKPILMLSMADWYLKSGQEGDNEHSRLSRILDVAQDLKALSLMLNGQPFPFVIDLAILASRREYLNLEKWLTDKVRFRLVLYNLVKPSAPPWEHQKSALQATVPYRRPLYTIHCNLAKWEQSKVRYS